MNVLVAYMSQTGNTEKVAQAIYDALEVEKSMIPIKEVTNAEQYDVIFCGFPVHAHSVPVSAQEFVKGLPKGKKIALFVTHGSLTGGELATTAIEHAVSIASQLKVLGTYGCRGKVDSKILDAIKDEAVHKTWAVMANSAASHPDKSDLEDAQIFAKTVIAKAAV